MAFVQHRTVGTQPFASGKLRRLHSQVLGKQWKAAALAQSKTAVLRVEVPASKGATSGQERDPGPPGV